MTTTDPTATPDAPVEETKKGRFGRGGKPAKNTNTTKAAKNGADNGDKKSAGKGKAKAKKPAAKRENLLDYKALQRQAAPYLIPAVAVFVLFWGVNQFVLASRTKKAEERTTRYASQLPILQSRLDGILALSDTATRAQAEAAVAQATAGFIGTTTVEFEEELLNVRQSIESLGARWIGFSVDGAATSVVPPPGATGINVSVTIKMPSPSEEIALRLIRTLQNRPRITLVTTYAQPITDTYTLTLTIFTLTLPSPDPIVDPGAPLPPAPADPSGTPGATTPAAQTPA